MVVEEDGFVVVAMSDYSFDGLVYSFGCLLSVLVTFRKELWGIWLWGLVTGVRSFFLFRFSFIIFYLVSGFVLVFYFI